MEGSRWVKVTSSATELQVNNNISSKTTQKINADFTQKEETKVTKIKEEVNLPEPETDLNNNELPKLDIKPEDLIRGTTPEDIENRCIDLVKTYIGGSWSNITSSADVVVTRISGGLTNQLYQVHLKDTVKRVANDIYPDEPSNVAIKVYQVC